jgi:hypothetical protein
VQADSINTRVESAFGGFSARGKIDEALSNFAFKINLRR